jgi:hypothetical protein
MSTRKIFFLIVALAAIIYIPYIGAFIHYDNGNFPEGYFDFPPIEKIDKPTQNWFVIICVGVVGLVLTLLYLFPRLFGFKKATEPKPASTNRVRLPIWFWIGLVAWAITLFILAAEFKEPKWFINWALIPLFWGFILFLDGLVYYLNGGRSMVRNAPAELVAMALVSISGWLIYEYLNFMIETNWYYPKARLLEDDEFILYAVLGSSGFIPMTFEWYQLLRSIKKLNLRYKKGPRIKFPNWLSILLLLACGVGLFVSPFKPNDLFYIVWLAPLIIVAIVLTKMGVWTPFTPIKTSGDWTALLVFALTFLIQGFCVEWWNDMSGHWTAEGELVTNNPAYWVYNIPYVTKWKIFEMPLLGYFGYLFFSIHCWLWWILFAQLMGVKNDFTSRPEYQ